MTFEKSPKLVVMGRNKDYFKISFNAEKLRKEIEERGVRDDKLDDFLRVLEIEGKKVHASSLRAFGSGVRLYTPEIIHERNLIQAIQEIFRVSEEYCERHGGNYALIQDLRREGANQRGYDLSALVSLWI